MIAENPIDYNGWMSALRATIDYGVLHNYLSDKIKKL